MLTGEAESALENGSVRISREVVEAIRRHALEANPSECCGLLSGIDSVQSIFPLRNQAESPGSRYFAAPADLFSAMRKIRESGEKMIGIYHSHPRTAASPSAADIEMAFYPEAVYFIISLEPRMELRGFRIRQGRATEVDLIIEAPVDTGCSGGSGS